MPTLVSGLNVPSNSEAWRHECEARYILSLPTVEARREWLAKIEKRRGSADRLRETMKQLWEKR